MDEPNEFDALTQNSSKKPKTKQIVPKYLIKRNVFSQEAVIKETGYEARDKSILHSIRDNWFQINWCNIFRNIFPIIQWLPKYSIRKYFIGDLIAGMTVAVMHIPQGLAYGILAGLTADVGLYMAFFPVLIYVLLGTSRHISMGTFAVISLMTLKVVQNYATEGNLTENKNSTENFINSVQEQNHNYTRIEVATATTIAVGIIHIIMGIARAGALASLLSEPLVNGFTTAAAVHVVTTQIKDILGITVPRHKGSFKVIYTLIDYCKQIENTNFAALIFSICIIIFMTTMNEFIKPWLSKKFRFPLPAELIAVVGATLIMRYFLIGMNYNIQLIGDIPSELPTPKFPPINLIRIVALDSIAIAIVSYSVVMSMALIFAKKHSYEVKPNQELFAIGAANIFGGMFSCIPLACSLSRSLIQEKTGGMTQIASVVSALIILMILLFISPFFNTLPRCVLAGIIVVALKGMFMQATELKKYSKQGKIEFFTWICTFFGVVLIDIDIGLFIGILVSIAGIYIKGFKPYSALLGTIPDTGIYVDLKNHKNAKEIPGVKIFQYFGSINFATCRAFKKYVYKNLEINQDELCKTPIYEDKSNSQVNNSTKCYSNHFHSLILDLSAVAHIDYAGSKTLFEITQEMETLHIQVYLTNPSDIVYDNLIHSMTLGEGCFQIMPTVHDAVLYIQANVGIV